VIRQADVVGSMMVWVVVITFVHCRSKEAGDGDSLYAMAGVM
jgi:hypothetical protein